MSDELSNRVQVLETKVDFMENSMFDSVNEELRTLKQNQFKFFGRFSDMEKRFSEMEGRISDFRAHADERISNLQAHMDDRFINVEKRFSEMHVHIDERFLGVEERISELQAHTDERITGVYQAIANQTRWVLTVMVSSITIASIVIPVLIKYL